MQYTNKLGLKKPELTDYVNVNDINDNMDILDTEIANITDPTTGVEAKLTQHLEEKATKVEYGHVKVGEGITVSDGVISTDYSKTAKTATGTFVGNDASSRSIVVGFTPKLLFLSSLNDNSINEAQVAVAVYNSVGAKIIDNGTSNSSVTSVHGSYGGPNITEDGFTVSFNTTAKVGFNNNGKSYGWVAIG